MTRAQIMERGCRIGDDTRALVLEEREALDIDDPLDLAVCEALLAAGGPHSRALPTEAAPAWPS
jgi:CMP-N-acetylneuraminic acid synthetase